MLYKNTEQPTSGNDAGVGATTPDQFDLRWMIGAVLQRRWLIVAFQLVMMALAVLFVLLRPPSYTASTQLQLTNLRLTLSREDTFFAETHPDPTFLETQLQIIRSDRVALSVLNNLQMLPADAPLDQRAEALEKLRRGFFVDRAGLSNVVQIVYSTRDPELAARIANEFARAYITDQNAARLDAAQAGSSWLRDRLREIGPKARIIAEALPPLHKSNVRGILIIAVAGILGGLLGVVGAIAWRFIDQRIATPEEARAATGAECLGIIPCLPTSARGKVKRKVEEDLGERNFAAKPPILAYTLDHPLSQAWYTLRNVKASCQDCFGGKGLRYLGVTSTVAGEGRSTVAANLALALAVAKKRVLLVDSDVYNPSLTRQFASEDRPGLVNYLQSDKDALKSYVLTEHRAGLDFLSLGVGKDVIGGNIWTDGLRRFFEETVSSYDYVIFDMPSLGMLGDMRDAARYVDGFLLVIGWQQASMESIQFGMRAASTVHDRLLGSVLNNVNTKEARWALSPETTFSRRQNIAVRSTWGQVSKPSMPKKLIISVLIALVVTATAIASIP